MAEAMFKLKVELGISTVVQWVRTWHNLHENVGSILGLTQWIKDLVLLQATAKVTDVAWIQHCCGCGLGWELPYATSVPKKKKKSKNELPEVYFILDCTTSNTPPNNVSTHHWLGCVLVLVSRVLYYIPFSPYLVHHTRAMTGNLYPLCQNVRKANKSMSFKALITQKTNSRRSSYC